MSISHRIALFDRGHFCIWRWGPAALLIVLGGLGSACGPTETFDPTCLQGDCAGKGEFTPVPEDKRKRWEAAVALADKLDGSKDKNRVLLVQPKVSAFERETGYPSSWRSWDSDDDALWGIGVFWQVIERTKSGLEIADNRDQANYTDHNRKLAAMLAALGVSKLPISRVQSWVVELESAPVHGYCRAQAASWALACWTDCNASERFAACKLDPQGIVSDLLGDSVAQKAGLMAQRISHYLSLLLVDEEP